MTTDDCLAGWCQDDEWCGITCAAEIIGKKWYPVIVHRLLARGPSGFNDLKEAVDGISSNVLSNNLDDLGENDIVNREIVSEKPFRVEYSLTERGEDLEPIIDAMEEWGDIHGPTEETPPTSH